MRITLLIGEAMVAPMDGDPECGGELQATGTQESECVLQPKWALEAAMGNEAMKAEIPTASRTTPVQLKNQGKNARHASKWQIANAIRVSFLKFIARGLGWRAAIPSADRSGTDPAPRAIPQSPLGLAKRSSTRKHLRT
jgi:hypothetical protein